MIDYSKIRPIDVIEAHENASDIFSGEEAYDHFNDVHDVSCIGYAMWVNREYLGVFAISKPVDGESDVVAIMTDAIKRHPKTAVEGMKHLCDLAEGFYGVTKMNFLIKDDFPRGEKYAKVLGFKTRGEDLESDGIKYRCYWRVA